MGVSATFSRTRSLWWIVCLLALCTLTFLRPLPAAHAQEGAAPAENAPAPEQAQGSENLFMHIIRSAGPVFGPLLLAISICLVALIVLLAMDLRMSTSIPPDFVEEFTDTVNKQAFEMAKAEPSFLGRVLTAGMGRLQYGLDDAREMAFNTVENIRASKDQLLSYVATIGTLGPMIGLVGTVFGMILSFMELGTGHTPKPEVLAAGISKAPVITLLGIALAVPAIFAHAFFRNRLIRISTEAGTIADDLLTQMYHFSRKPAAPEKPATAAPAPTAEPRAAAAAIKTAP
jgi:biopolymer transport protein ExbB